MINEPETLQKAQVSLPPPGIGSRWALIGGTTQLSDIVMPDKRQQAAIYYEMYRQHPVVRAAIDKKAQYASAGGFKFRPTDVASELNARKAAILERFFRNSSPQQLIRLTYKDLDIYGESFWVIIKTLRKTPIKAMRLNPRYMNPVVRGGLIHRWIYGPVSGDTKAIEYEDEIILHFKLDDPENDVQGISPLHPLQRAVAQDIFAMEYNESFFRNAAQTGTIFILRNSSEEEGLRNRQWLEENYVGAENAHHPLLLEGDVDVQKSVADPQEMEFLRGRMLLRQEIAMCLEVDLEKLGVHEDSNRSVSRSVDESFHSESVWPRQIILEEEINNKLILNVFGWNDVLFEHNDRDPRGSQEQADIDNKNLNTGRETINDQRMRLGLSPVSGGDEPFVMTPTGIIFVKNFTMLAEQQSQSAMPLQAVGGAGSKGQASPDAAAREPLPARQAEDSNQNEQ